MKKTIISIFFTLAMLSCKNSNDKNISSEAIGTDSLNNAAVQKDIMLNDEKNVEKNESFTIDCGSGCAMIYYEVFRKNNKNLVEIRYKVTQYINEKIEDEYLETYIFESDKNRNLSGIYLNKNKENILNDNSSLLRDKLLEISGKLYHKKVSSQPDFKETGFVSGNKPYNLMAVPFDLKNYADNLPNQIKNSYSPTAKTKKYLVSIGYDAESYKCFFIKNDNSSTELIVSVSRGESEYFLLLKANKDTFLSYKEIGNIGGEEARCFKIDKNYNVVSY
ncbi:hypothetical protein [Flavobacterium sp. JAS]|uniref:hypothetical protein n=1 Tax=Flavobacterium sp. JAS TaxID=2897329 RepID=UPI001E406F56|nr:hypothetical protein [Flavobacterium sp. JAS]MCD0472299.1 hypothetical protein [Flavobacterium sp. JAS]